MAQNWLEIRIDVPEENLGSLTELLTARGMTGLITEDGSEFRRTLEESGTPLSDVAPELLSSMQDLCRIRFYVTDDDEGRRKLSEYLRDVEYPFTESPVRETDWETSWQKYYRPMPVGDRLYIIPDWSRDAAVPDGRIPLYLDPGTSFGTGEHASTKLCLQFLQETDCTGAEVLDLGCGSGILSAAALLLGARRALAVDIDPAAAAAARENAARNGFPDSRCSVLCGDILSEAGLQEQITGRKYQVVFANIVADIIIGALPLIAGVLAEDGVLITSGIIDTREADVRAALMENGFCPTGRKMERGWVALTAVPSPH